MAGLLDGLVVLDLSMFIAGPFGSMILADLGADVIKVEPLGGDPVRSNGIGPQIRGENAQFYGVNRNKRSLAIDLKHPEGRAVFLDLVRQADVVFDNFRPGVLSRLGLDHDALSRVNPRIITCSVSGYGQDGPWAGRPAFDLVVQALAGGMSMTGHPETGPARMGFAIGDLGGGIFAAIGILAAVAERARTGRGRRIDIGLLDVQIALLWEEVTYCLSAGLVARQWGTAHPFLVPYQAFATADQPLVVAAVGTERFWAEFCLAIGRPELAADPRFTNNERRVQHRQELEPILAAAFQERTRDQWLDVLAAAGIPAAPILAVDQALATPQVRHRQMAVPVPDPEAGPVYVAGNPIKVAGAAQAPFRPAPRLGGDTHEILLQRLGYSSQRVASLEQANVIRQRR